MAGKKKAKQLTKYMAGITFADVHHIGTLDDLDATGAEGLSIKSYPVNINGKKGVITWDLMWTPVQGLTTEGSATWNVIFFIDKSEHFFVLFESLEDDEAKQVWKDLKKKFGTAKKKKSQKKNKKGKKKK